MSDYLSITLLQISSGPVMMSDMYTMMHERVLPVPDEVAVALDEHLVRRAPVERRHVRPVSMVALREAMAGRRYDAA